MDARTQAWIDQEDAHVAKIVREYGWFIRYVGGDSCSAPSCDCSNSPGPPFAYTVGLFGLAHPELLIFDVSQHTAAGVLNSLANGVRAGDAIMPGRLFSFDQWAHRIIPEEVPNPGEIVFDANRYYQRPDEYSVPVLQLSYDDTEGNFPWEDENIGTDVQPRPGTFKA